MDFPVLLSIIEETKTREKGDVWEGFSGTFTQSRQKYENKA